MSDVARAAGNLGTFGSGPMASPPPSASGDQTETAHPSAFPDASDPAFDKAYVIDELTSRLSEITMKKLDTNIEQSTREELLHCLADVSNCKISLEAESRKTNPIQIGCEILADCEKVSLHEILDCFSSSVQIVKEMVENWSKTSDFSDKAWKDLVVQWKREVADTANKAAKFKTQAAAQPGRAYGQVGHPPTSLRLPSGTNGSAENSPAQSTWSY